MRRAFEDSWLSDDPLTELDDPNLLGRSNLVQSTIDVLSRVRKQSQSTTIGLIGAWGSGKTSALNGLRRQLEQPSDFANQVLGESWSVGLFNPWLYSDPASLHSGFFADLRAALPKDGRWSEARANLVSLGRRLSPLTALTGMLGLSTEQALERLLGQLESSTAVYMANVEKQLSELNRPVLMIIDDLDRLSADELLHVFKLVRLVGRLPNVYYLVSYDEHTLVDLLGKTDLVSTEDDRRALDYLEKIIQVRLDMPLLRNYEVDRVVGRSLQYLSAQHSITLAPNELSTLVRRFDGVLSKRLRTPRAIKRLFGQLDAFLPGVGREVDFSDFVILTWLRTIEPRVYNLVQTYRDELLGTNRDVLRDLSMQKRSYRQLREDWLIRLGAAHVAAGDLDDLLYLLSTLFPSLDPVYRGDDTYPNRDRYQREPEVRRIAHPDYFDRYFMFGVPDDDIADATVVAAIADLESGDAAGISIALLERTFSNEPELVIRKLWHQSERGHFSRPPLIAWLAARYSELPPESTVRGRIEGLVAILAGELTPADALSLVNALSTSGAGLYLAGMVRHLLAADAIGSQRVVESRNAIAAVVTPTLAGLFRNHFVRWAGSTTTPLEIPVEAARVVWLWREFDAEGVRSLLEEAVAARQWDLIDELAWLVPIVISSTNESRISRYDDVQHLGELFDLDRATELLQDEISLADRMEAYRDAEATLDNRRGFVLALLKYRQDGVHSTTDIGDV